MFLVQSRENIQAVVVHTVDNIDINQVMLRFTQKAWRHKCNGSLQAL